MREGGVGGVHRQARDRRRRPPGGKRLLGAGQPDGQAVGLAGDGAGVRARQGDLAERLLQALEAAEREGGDIRGRQSAAIVVVAGAATGRPWADRLVDLRVEDHPAPLVELRRLVTLSRLYRRMNEGDEWTTRGDMTKAVTAYNQAIGLLPDSATNGEAVFWTGISLVTAGREREAMPYLARAYAVHPAWADLLPRLPDAGLLPRDKALIARLVAGMRRGTARPREMTSTDRRSPMSLGTSFLDQVNRAFDRAAAFTPPRSRAAEQHQGVQEPLLHQLPGETGRRQHRGDARVAGRAQPPQAPLQGRDPLRAGRGRG